MEKGPRLVGFLDALVSLGLDKTEKNKETLEVVGKELELMNWRVVDRRKRTRARRQRLDYGRTFADVRDRMAGFRRALVDLFHAPEETVDRKQKRFDALMSEVVEGPDFPDAGLTASVQRSVSLHLLMKAVMSTKSENVTERSQAAEHIAIFLKNAPREVLDLTRKWIYGFLTEVMIEARVGELPKGLEEKDMYELAAEQWKRKETGSADGPQFRSWRKGQDVGNPEARS